MWALWIVALVLASTAVACADPVANQRRDSLGGEAPGVPRGPTHRPGQPCTWCHDGSYEFEMSVAGTVFAALDGKQPVAGAKVSLTDSTGRTVEIETNCAGNFYLEPSAWTPAFPLRASISFGGETQTMTTLIHREASCAACHLPTPSASSPGPVFLFKGAVPAGIPGGCR